MAKTDTATFAPQTTETKQTKEHAINSHECVNCTAKAPKHTSTSESWSWFDKSIKQAYEKYNVLYGISK